MGGWGERERVSSMNDDEWKNGGKGRREGRDGGEERMNDGKTKNERKS